MQRSHRQDPYEIRPHNGSSEPLVSRLLLPLQRLIIILGAVLGVELLFGTPALRWEYQVRSDLPLEYMSSCTLYTATGQRVTYWGYKPMVAFLPSDEVDETIRGFLWRKTISLWDSLVDH